MRKDKQIHPDLRAALALLGEIPDTAQTRGECWKAVAPKCPEGKMYASWNFWGRIEIPVKFRTNVAGLAESIHEEKRLLEKAEKQWPPKPVFVPWLHLPQPDPRK